MVKPKAVFVSFLLIMIVQQKKEMLENLKAEANHNLDIFKCMCVKHSKTDILPNKVDHRLSQLTIIYTIEIKNQGPDIIKPLILFIISY
jgi:hypothetical protein